MIAEAFAALWTLIHAALLWLMIAAVTVTVVVLTVAAGVRRAWQTLRRGAGRARSAPEALEAPEPLPESAWPKTSPSPASSAPTSTPSAPHAAGPSAKSPGRPKPPANRSATPPSGASNKAATRRNRRSPPSSTTSSHSPPSSDSGPSSSLTRPAASSAWTARHPGSPAGPAGPKRDRPPARLHDHTPQETHMTDQTRTFALADILTMTTGRLMSARRIEAVYDISNWMTGDNLMTHQLPRAAEACGPALLAQHPQLVGVEPPEDIDVPDLMAWLADAERQHGQELPVAPLPEGAWEHRNPIEELCDMVGPERVIVALVPDGDEQQP